MDGNSEANEVSFWISLFNHDSRIQREVGIIGMLFRFRSNNEAGE